MEDNQQSPFQKVAEMKVPENVKKDEAFLKQRYILAHNIMDMGQQLNSKGLRRAIAGAFAPITGKKVAFQDKVEEEIANQFRKLIGCEVHLIVSNDQLLDAVVKDANKIREIYQQQKDAEEAAEAQKNLKTEGNE